MAPGPHPGLLACEAFDGSRRIPSFEELSHKVTTPQGSSSMGRLVEVLRVVTGITSLKCEKGHLANITY
jgi:hypothetical protein